MSETADTKETAAKGDCSKRRQQQKKRAAKGDSSKRRQRQARKTKGDRQCEETTKNITTDKNAKRETEPQPKRQNKRNNILLIACGKRQIERETGRRRKCK